MELEAPECFGPAQNVVPVQAQSLRQNPACFHQTGEPTSPQGHGLATVARNGMVRDAEWAKLANFAKPPDSGSSKNGCRPAAKEKRLER